MPMLALGGTTIPVDGGPITIDEIEIGDQGRTDDGTYVSDIDERKTDLPLRTRMLTSAEYTSVMNALVANPPIAATGTLVGGGYNVAVEIKRTLTDSFASGVRRSIEFILHQV